MRILAIDAATKTGWAVWNDRDKRVSFGSSRFEGEIGEFADGFERWLVETIDKNEISSIAVEAPLPIIGNTSMVTMLRAYGAYVLVRKVGVRRSIPVDAVNVGTWRSYFIGRARAPIEIEASKRRAWLKRAVIDECCRRGWEVGKDNDAADALGLMSYERAMLDPAYGSETTELFRNAA